MDFIRLNVVELILDSGAVTATVWPAPCHHASICQNRSKSIPCTTDLLDILIEQMLDSEAVTTTWGIAAGDNPVSSNTPRSKRRPCRSYFWLLGDSCKAVSILQPRMLQSHVGRKGARQTQQASGSVAPKPVARFFSSQQHSVTVPNRETATVSRRPLGRTRQI